MAAPRKRVRTNAERLIEGLPALPPAPARGHGAQHAQRSLEFDGKVYGAEDAWEEEMRSISILGLTAVERGMVSVYFEEVMRTFWVRYDHAEAVARGVHVRFERGKNRKIWANTDYGILSLPYSVRVWPIHILLHELAHMLVPGGVDIGHGELWQRTYIRLLRSELGRYAADRMASLLAGKGVLNVEP